MFNPIANALFRHLSHSSPAMHLPLLQALGEPTFFQQLLMPQLNSLGLAAFLGGTRSSKLALRAALTGRARGLDYDQARKATGDRAVADQMIGKTEQFVAELKTKLAEAQQCRDTGKARHLSRLLRSEKTNLAHLRKAVQRFDAAHDRGCGDLTQEAQSLSSAIDAAFGRHLDNLAFVQSSPHAGREMKAAAAERFDTLTRERQCRAEVSARIWR